MELSPPPLPEPIAGRPSMGGGDYGISKDPPDPEALPWSQVQGWLAASRSYWICTTRADGRPHAMPVWAVWLDGAVVFSTDPTSIKGRNLAARPDIVVHLESGDEVCVVEGQAERVSGEAVGERFVDLYEAKYAFRIDLDKESYGFYRVRPRVVLAWLESSFPTTATRWEFPG
jgi:hypothetical protein